MSTAVASDATSSSGSPSVVGVRERLVGVDLVRGAVMVLMAIDHVRVFSGLPAGGPTPGIFFTRWITHFCAPAFVFLAGTGAFFHGRKLGDVRRLSGFLAIRGLWLVFLELTFLRLAWTFNVDYAHFTMAGIIWAIGWCMVLLALMVRLPTIAVGVIGVAVIAGHNIMDLVGPAIAPALQASPWAWLLRVLYFGGPIQAWGEGAFFVLYSLVPWVGVMAAGYGFGAILAMDPVRRRRWCLTIGIGATLLFLVLRGFHTYGNPPARGRGAAYPALLAFLNTTKYPASLQFLLMTLGPMIALLPFLDRATGKGGRVLVTFGRVPLFFYVLHIPLIHVVAVLISLVRTPDATPWLIGNHPIYIGPAPAGYVWSLQLLYFVTTVVVMILYPPCRWFAEVKRRRRESWLSFL